MTFDPARCRRLLIFGGSFDPPHRAHVDLPAEAARAVGAGGILYIPAGQPPHKPDRVITPAEHRLAMLQLALAGRDHVAICRDEIDRPGPSYMVDTLEQLHARMPHVRMQLLIGADMAAIFYKWRSPRRIIELADPLVMVRPPLDADAIVDALPHDLPADEKQPWRRRVVQTRTRDISSTRLRQHLAAGDDDDPLVRDALHPAVLNYIREHNLYRTNPA